MKGLSDASEEVARVGVELIGLLCGGGDGGNVVRGI